MDKTDKKDYFNLKEVTAFGKNETTTTPASIITSNTPTATTTATTTSISTTTKVGTTKTSLTTATTTTPSTITSTVTESTSTTTTMKTDLIEKCPAQFERVMGIGNKCFYLHVDGRGQIDTTLNFNEALQICKEKKAKLFEPQTFD